MCVAGDFGRPEIRQRGLASRHQSYIAGSGCLVRPKDGRSRQPSMVRGEVRPDLVVSRERVRVLAKVPGDAAPPNLQRPAAD